MTKLETIKTRLAEYEAQLEKVETAIKEVKKTAGRSLRLQRIAGIGRLESHRDCVLLPNIAEFKREIEPLEAEAAILAANAKAADDTTHRNDDGSTDFASLLGIK